MKTGALQPLTSKPITILGISPRTSDPLVPAKVAKGEVFPVSADIFQESKHITRARVILKNARGKTLEFPMYLANPGRDTFKAWVSLPSEGLWEFHIEAWRDKYAEFEIWADAKIIAEQDLELVELEAKRAVQYQGKRFAKTVSGTHSIYAKPANALFTSWYEMFPRSEGAVKKNGKWISGTFDSASKRLPAIKKMGFDIVYIPPIHPIGFSFRKGKDNSPSSKPGDPGSPWAIGSDEGGHDKVFSELGGIQAFRRFIKTAKANDLRVSIDFALQCSPDHPWLKSHKDWFNVRADGSIAYAENPPKKYQDIYPISFELKQREIEIETIRILNLWIKEGITIFRVDNPHTKPVSFWQHVIEAIHAKHPEVFFLAEAFTKPPMMRALALAGFEQSHSYFLWRETKIQLGKYFQEITGKIGFTLWPSFWPSTPDNLTEVLVKGGIPAHKIRAILAATGSPSWGIYSGYELAEREWDESKKEFAHNEKYEFRPRDWSKTSKYGIADLLTKLNKIRNSNLAFHSLHNIVLHKTSSPKVLAFGRHFEFGKAAEDIIIIVNLDYAKAKTFNFEVKWKDLIQNRPSLPAKSPESIKAVDLLSGKKFTLTKSTKLTLPPSSPALILKLQLN